jgi:hypothetical protein
MRTLAYVVVALALGAGAATALFTPHAALGNVSHCACGLLHRGEPCSGRVGKHHGCTCATAKGTCN